MAYRGYIVSNDRFGTARSRRRARRAHHLQTLLGVSMIAGSLLVAGLVVWGTF